MAKKFKLKRDWKKLLVVGLSVILGIGAIFGITRLAEEAEETHKKINPTFTVGGLNDSGKYEETEESIYTKTAFECQGLKITSDFDNTISFKVYFYDHNNQFIESTETQTMHYQGTPIFAKYARIEITPNDDDKVSWYEVSQYANQLDIEVSKKQNFKVPDLMLSVDKVENKVYLYDSTDEVFKEKDFERGCYSVIEVSNLKYLDCTFQNATYMWTIYFLDSNNEYLGQYNTLPDVYFERIELPKNCSYVVFNCSLVNIPIINAGF